MSEIQATTDSCVTLSWDAFTEEDGAALPLLYHLPPGCSLSPHLYTPSITLLQHQAHVESLKVEMEVRLASCHREQAEIAAQLASSHQRNNELANGLVALQEELSHTQEELSTLRGNCVRLSTMQGDLLKRQGELADIQSVANSYQAELQRQQKVHNQEIISLKQSQLMLTEQVMQASASASHWGTGLTLALVFLIAALITGGIFLHKRVKAYLHSVDEKQADSLQQRAEMLELISTHLKANYPVASGDEPDHAAMLKFANEISRMEMNLNRMDTSVKGHKQLIRGLERIRNNLAAAGYEMVPMLGLLYQEGLRADADFIVDESLPEGERRITSVVRPQVNYKGVLIQKANITVSQNI